MFGYVRPNRDELKVRELRDYEALYCGLCHALGRRHGFFARFFLNYDFTFLAMLLDLSLIHIYHRIDKPGDVLSEGQMVDVKIIDIDYDNKKVSLSIRALLEGGDEPAESEDVNEE